MSTNPFQSPDANGREVIDPDTKALLSGLRTPVLWVAAATILFTVGSVLSAATAVWFYYPTLEPNAFDDPDQGRMATVVKAAAASQLIMACGFGYMSWLIVRYAKALRRASQSEVVCFSEVFTTQRSCWCAAAVLAAIFVLLRVSSALISEI